MASYTLNLKPIASVVGGDGHTYTTLVDSGTPGDVSCGTGYVILKTNGTPSIADGDDIAVTVEE
jgi:hypothetical protein